MYSTKKELKSLFKNGSLPTGENFGTLIDSLVGQAEFSEHVKAYEDWISRGQITLGKADDAWQIGPDPKNQLQIASKSDPVPESPSNVNVVGVIGMHGRVGTSLAGGLFSENTPAFDIEKLGQQTHIGIWTELIAPPSRTCIFEVCAALETRKEEPDHMFWRILRGIMGWQKAGNATLYAMVTATGAAGKPTFSLLRSPDPQAAWRSAFRRLLALLVIVFLAGQVLQSTTWQGYIPKIDALIEKAAADFEKKLQALEKETKPTPTSTAQDTGELAAEGNTPAATTDQPEEVLEAEAEHVGIWLVQQVASLLNKGGLGNLAALLTTFSGIGFGITLVAFAWLVRNVIVALRASMTCIGLRWVKTGGSRITGSAAYTLQMRGPKGVKPSATSGLRYHITKLWG